MILTAVDVLLSTATKLILFQILTMPFNAFLAAASGRNLFGQFCFLDCVQ